MSLDAGVLIELLSGTETSKSVREAIENDQIQAYSSFITLTEAEYILCRQLGRNKAREKINNLVESRTIELVEDSTLLPDAAEIKCDRAIAIGDCYTIALATKVEGTALFVHQEEDMKREVGRKPFPVKIIFLDSLPTP